MPRSRFVRSEIRKGTLGLLTCIAFSGCASSPPPAIVLTTDIGVETDDQWALAYLALLHQAGRVDLRAVVTTHAPSLAAPASESSRAAALEVLRRVALTAPPRHEENDFFYQRYEKGGEASPPKKPPRLLAGASTPLVPVAGRAEPGPGGKAILEAARGFDRSRRLSVLSIGAATDVADALRSDPTLADRIQIIAMGFEQWPRGGDPWNVKNDPLAYRILLASNVPLTIGAADVCVRDLALDAGDARRITEGGGSLGVYLRDVFEAWVAKEDELCRKYTGRAAWPIWDVVTIAAALGWADVETRPRPRLREDLTFELSPAQGELAWITRVDEARVWSDFQSLLVRSARR